MKKYKEEKVTYVAAEYVLCLDELGGENVAVS